jgi:multisubunit Na+/H+ antiporter MnhG subunit
MHAFLLFAAEGAADHGSKTAFYVAGLVLAGFAVLIGAIGVARPSFPGRENAAHAVIGAAAVLVVATIAAAIATSS